MSEHMRHFRRSFGPSGSFRGSRRGLYFPLIALAGLTGCQQGSDGTWNLFDAKLGAKENEPNVIRVHKFFPPSPWLAFQPDGTGNIDGVKFNVYLEGAGSPKGVFGTGDLVVTMYRIDHDPVGREVAIPLHEWVFDREQAYPWRAKARSAMGWGYGMRLNWPAHVEVLGKQIAIIVKYIRPDGRVLRSSRQLLRVPRPGLNIPEISDMTLSPRDQVAKKPAPPREVQGTQ